MSKLSNLTPKLVLAPFKSAMNSHFDKVCADVQSNLGRLEKDIITKSTDWQCGTKGAIVSKDGHKLQLPLNAPWATLLRFGLQIGNIIKNGSSDEPKYVMIIESELPAECVSWFKQNYETKRAVEVSSEVAVEA